MTGGRRATSQWNPLTKAKRKALTNSIELGTHCLLIESSVSLKSKLNVTRISKTSKKTPNMRTLIINRCYQPRRLALFVNGWHERRFLKERSNYFPPSRMRSLFVMSVIVFAEYLSPHLVLFFTVSKFKACYGAFFLLYFPLIGNF